MGRSIPRQRDVPQSGHTEEDRPARQRPALPPTLADAETLRLVHELQVHQLELEMQNKELIQTRDQVSALLDAYTDLYDFAPVGYLTLDRAGTVVKANLTAATLLRLERSGLLGMDFSKVLTTESRAEFSGFVTTRFDGGEGVAYCDLACREHPGRVAWIRMEAYGVIPNRELRVALLDISERKREEEARRQAEVHLAMIQHLESIGVIASGVAHNINNVLAVIMCATEVRQMQGCSTDYLKVFDIIDSACKRGRDVVRALVQFARPSLQDIIPLDLTFLLVELGLMLEVTAQPRITIARDFLPEPVWVSGNAGVLSSALLNIGLNALDALPERGTLTMRTTAPAEGWVGVRIEDDGTGMAPEILAKVLDPFFTTKPVGKGTGLGLSMAYGVIKAHGGTLEISSELGKGTVVEIRIPRIQAPVQEMDLPPAPPTLDSLNVLVVDDDEDVRVLASRMLKAEGMEASCVDGGEAALEYLRTHPLPDLVLLDQNMPGMDGVETMQAIRFLHPELPILISSGRLEIESWGCFKWPKVAFLPKPFGLVEFRDELKKLGLKPKDK